MQVNLEIQGELAPLFNLSRATTAQDLFGQPGWYKHPYLKKIARTIKQWNECLDLALENARGSRLELKQLQASIKPLSDNAKVTLLRSILTSNLTPSIDKAITRLERLIRRVMEAISHEPTGYTLNSPFAFPAYLLRQPSPSIEKAQNKLREEARHSYITNKFKVFIEKDNWFEPFIKEFIKLSDTSDVISAVSILGLVHLIELVNYHLKQPDRYFRIPSILLGISESLILDFLADIAANELNLLNIALIKDNNTTLLQDLLNAWRDVLIKESNRIRDEIDFVAEYLRNVGLSTLKFDELESKLRPLQISIGRMRKIGTHFSDLMKNIKLDAETKKIPSDIDLECDNHLQRITNSSKGNMQGNVYHILFRRAFDDLDLEDDAIEIISKWNLLSAENFPEVFGKQFEDNKSAHAWLDGKFKESKIKTIGDIKQKRLFNAHFFKRFLDQQKML